MATATLISAAADDDAERLTPDEFRAETDRGRMLIEFLRTPIAAYRGADNDEAPDDDVVGAYNLATIAALRAIRVLATRA